LIAALSAIKGLKGRQRIPVIHVVLSRKTLSRDKFFVSRNAKPCTPVTIEQENSAGEAFTEVV
jgi:hypothetical protein